MFSMTTLDLPEMVNGPLPVWSPLGGGDVVTGAATVVVV
jgi:hypothetical protein